MESLWQVVHFPTTPTSFLSTANRPTQPTNTHNFSPITYHLFPYPVQQKNNHNSSLITYFLTTYASFLPQPTVQLNPPTLITYHLSLLTYSPTTPTSFLSTTYCPTKTTNTYHLSLIPLPRGAKKHTSTYQFSPSLITHSPTPCSKKPTKMHKVNLRVVCLSPCVTHAQQFSLLNLLTTNTS